MWIRLETAPLALAATLAIAGCGLYGVDGNGERATEVRPLQGFSAVETDGSLDVVIQRGDTFNVEVSIDSNLLRELRTELADGGETLWIDLEGPVWDVLPGPHVIVTMPVLRRAVLAGSGAVTAAGFEQAEPTALELDGSGRLTFTGDVPAAQVRSWGSGEVRLHGSAGSLDARLDGSGAVDASDFATATADLALSGSGNMAAHVSDSVRVSLSGSGNVDIYGGAVIERASVSGSGSLTQH
jgi:hypothetical protein